MTLRLGDTGHSRRGRKLERESTGGQGVGESSTPQTLTSPVTGLPSELSGAQPSSVYMMTCLLRITDFY
jgi:hypothetical protein